MKERETRPNQSPQEDGLRTTAQYSLEELLQRAGEEEEKERENQGSQTEPLPPSKAQSRSVTEEPRRKMENISPPKDSAAAVLAAQKAKKKAGRNQPTVTASARKWKERLKAVAQGREDDEPDEMEKIYGDRPILGASKEESTERKKPQFSYLFEEEPTTKPEDGASVPASVPGDAPSSSEKDKGICLQEEPILPEEPGKKPPASTKEEPVLVKGAKEKERPAEGREPAAHSGQFSERPEEPQARPPKPEPKSQEPTDTLPKEGPMDGEGQEPPSAIPQKEPPKKPVDRPLPTSRRKLVGEDLIDEGDEGDPGEENYRVKQKPPVNRYEKLFGKPQPAKGDKKEQGPSSGKKTQKERKRGIYSVEDRVPIVLDSEEVKEALLDEYEEYRRAQEKKPDLPVEPQLAAKRDKKAVPKQSQPGKEPSKEKKGKFAIFGDTEPDDGAEPFPPARNLPALDDYTEPDDAFSVRAEIMDNMRTLLLRTVATGITAFLAVAITVLYHLDLPMLESIKGSPYWYLAGNLLLLLVSAAFSHVPMRAGIKPLLRMQGNADTGIAFAAWVSILHGIAAFFTPNAYLTGNLNVYGVLVILGLFLNSWGKLIMVRRVYFNFKYVSSPDRKFAVKIVSDGQIAEKMSKGMGLEKPIIAYQRRTHFLTNFLRLSYEPDPSERLAARIAPIGVVASILVGAGCLFLMRDVQCAFAALSVSACICVPMCCVPGVNLLMRRLSKRALRTGSMLVGYPGVEQFADTNAIILDASQLYPRGSVALHGMKGFSGERIDEAILDAGAVMCQAGGPMASTFEQIIQGKSELLPKVDSLAYEDEMGIIGWVHGRRVLVGNRRLMEEHGITPPDRTVEEQYTQNGRQITYLATAGELRALFVTSYVPDENMIFQMQKMEEQGVCFLIRTCDPNVTARMVSDHFRVYYRSVRILPDHQSQFYADGQTVPEEHTRAYLATRGKPAALLRILTSCIRVRSNVTLSLVLQVFGVALGFLLTAFLIFSSGLGQLGTLEMLIYTVFWILAVLIVPSIRKP